MAITDQDKSFLHHLDALEPQSTCLRAKIASLLVLDGKILLETKNDFHKKYNCNKIGCIRDIMKIPSGHQREICYGLCAEQWMFALAAKQGIKVEGATLYVTKHPCRICASMIAESGIARVVYQIGYPEVIPHFNVLVDYGVIVEKGPDIVYPEDADPAMHALSV